MDKKSRCSHPPNLFLEKFCCNVKASAGSKVYVTPSNSMWTVLHLHLFGRCGCILPTSQMERLRLNNFSLLNFADNPSSMLCSHSDVQQYRGERVGKKFYLKVSIHSWLQLFSSVFMIKRVQYHRCFHEETVKKSPVVPIWKVLWCLTALYDSGFFGPPSYITVSL